MEVPVDLNNLEQIGQTRPSDTNNAVLVSPNDFEKIVLTTIILCNTDSSSHDFRIFHDNDGTTYDGTTALFYDEALAANTTRILDFDLGLPILPDGNLAVRSDGADSITFTAYGIRIPRRLGG